MACTVTAPARTEFEFVRALHDQAREPGTCFGPVLQLSFSALRLSVLEEAFDSDQAHDLLWEGFHPEVVDAMAFSLCASHWLDLSCHVWLRARVLGRFDWHSAADRLLHDTCEAAGWDTKEIANMFVWQQARLT